MRHRPISSGTHRGTLARTGTVTRQRQVTATPTPTPGIDTAGECLSYFRLPTLPHSARTLYSKLTFGGFELEPIQALLFSCSPILLLTLPSPSTSPSPSPSAVPLGKSHLHFLSVSFFSSSSAVVVVAMLVRRESTMPHCPWACAANSDPHHTYMLGTAGPIVFV